MTKRNSHSLKQRQRFRHYLWQARRNFCCCRRPPPPLDLRQGSSCPCCPRTQRFAYLCLPSAGTKGLCRSHHGGSVRSCLFVWHWDRISRFSLAGLEFLLCRPGCLHLQRGTCLCLLRINGTCHHNWLTILLSILVICYIGLKLQ